MLYRVQFESRECRDISRDESVKCGHFLQMTHWHGSNSATTSRSGWNRLARDGPWESFSFTIFRRVKYTYACRWQRETHQTYEHLQQATEMPAVIRRSRHNGATLHTTSFKHLNSGQQPITRYIKPRLLPLISPPSHFPGRQQGWRSCIWCPSPYTRPRAAATSHSSSNSMDGMQ